MDGVSRFQTEDCEVFSLNDGLYTFDLDDFPTLSSDVLSARLRAAALNTIRTEFAAYLLRFADGETVMVDTGCGARFGAAGGQLPIRLAALGIKGEDVQRVILTHLHTDHSGGLLDVIFPNAELIVHRDEAAYWADQDHPSAVLLAGDRKIRIVTDKECIRPGLSVWALAGHTPGHIGLRVGDGLVLIGDVLHSEALQLPDPGLENANDVDRAAGAATRIAAWAEIADKSLVWSGNHMLGPAKFARLAREGLGFRRLPILGPSP